MKRIVAILLLVLFPLSLLVAGGSQEKAAAGQKTIRVLCFWSDTRFPTWKPSIADFEKLNPNVKVDFEMAGGTGSTQKMQTEMLSASPPDVILFWKFMFNEYANNGQLVDIAPRLQAANLMKGYFYPPALNWCSPKFDGHVYGLPDLIGPTLFFYNVDLFKKWGIEPPKSFDELLALGRRLQGQNVLPMVGDWQANVNILDPMAKIQVQTAGLQPIRDVVAYKKTFAQTPGLVQAGQMFKQMIDAGLITKDAASMNEQAAISAFVANKAAIYSNKANTIISVDQVKPANFNYDLFSVDFVKNPVARYSATFGAIWSIPIKSKNQDEAWSFLKWMWGVPWQKANVAAQVNLSSVPAANTAITQPVMRKIADTVMPTLTEDSFYLIDELPNPVLQELGTRLHQLVLGEVNTSQVLQYTQDALDKLKK